MRRRLPLVDLNSPDAGKQAQADKGVPAGSVIAVDKTGVVVNFAPFQPGNADHPGVLIIPLSGKTWISRRMAASRQKSPTRATGASLSSCASWTRRVVTGGIGPRAEGLDFKPGETRIFKVPLGNDNFHVTDYANVRGRFGPRAGAVPNKAKVAEIDIFLYHSIEAHSIHIDDLKAAGTAGDSEGSYADVDPGSVVTTPENGVIVGPGAIFDPARPGRGRPRPRLAPDGAIMLSFAGGQGRDHQDQASHGDVEFRERQSNPGEFKK